MTTIYPSKKVEKKPEVSSQSQKNEKKVKEDEKLNNLVKQSQHQLFECHTSRPFSIFPTTISIDINKIEIITRNFFKSQQVATILIENILFVTIETSVMFASLVIEVKGIEENPLPIKHLKKEDAKKARSIIMGLIACRSKEIDLSSVSHENLTEKIIKIGEAQGED